MQGLLKQEVLGQFIRKLRTKAGISLRRLAADTDFSPSFMSQVERGQVSPSISSMEKIAAAVGVSLGEFFAAAAGGEAGRIVRAADRQGLASEWSHAELEALTDSGSSLRLEAALITLLPGGRTGKHPRAHPFEEFGYVLQGQPTLTLGPEEHRLRVGDSVAILPGELRLWRNDGRAVARFLLVKARSGLSPDQTRTVRARPRRRA
jgi:transcriptional regulator with XRE-family HTH domain